MSKIVVTGGAGFIGSHITERCAKDEHEDVIIDYLDDYYSPDMKKNNIDCFLKTGNATFVRGDITDLTFLRTVSDNDTDYVFHEAAQAGVRISVENSFKPNKVNVFGTLNVLQASRDTEHTLADVRMAKELVGYKPGVDIEEGLKRFVEWYSNFGGQIWVQ
ncbi:MAG: GDP-mannose 4,6-dehydratase [Patescibacteria group bacterium]|nr:GDP-mannose 4,6-dehydratase [Patescibacteria group bacterium]